MNPYSNEYELVDIREIMQAKSVTGTTSMPNSSSTFPLSSTQKPAYNNSAVINQNQIQQTYNHWNLDTNRSRFYQHDNMNGKQSPIWYNLGYQIEQRQQQQQQQQLFFGRNTTASKSTTNSYQLFETKSSYNLLKMISPHIDYEYWTSIFNVLLSMIAAMTGSGLLVMAAAFSASGIIWALIQMIFCLLITFSSLHSIIISAHAEKTYSIQVLMIRTYGNTGLFIFNIMSYLVNWGTIVMCLEIAVDLFCTAFSSILRDNNTWFFDSNNIATIVIITTVSVFPLSFIRKVNGGIWFYIINLIIVTYFVIVTACELGIHGSLSTTWFMIDGFDNTFSTAVFTFACQMNVLEIIKDLPKEHNSDRPSIFLIDTVILVSMIITFIFSVAAGILGYITFGDINTNALEVTYGGEILGAYQLLWTGTEQFYDNLIESLMLLVVVATTISQIFNIMPARRELSAIYSTIDFRNLRLIPVHDILDKDEELYIFWPSFLTIYTSMIIVIVITKPNIIVNVVGAIFSPVVCFIMPYGLELELHKYSKKSYCYTLVLIGFITIFILFMAWSIINLFV